MQSIIQAFIDERNRSIWEAVNEAFTLRVQLYPGAYHHYELYEGQAYLFLSERNCTTESVTHELLHLYLRAKRIFLTEFLVRQLRQEPLLHWTFSESFFEQIGHHLEHVPMLPLYLGTGLQRGHFIPDFKAPICNPLLVQLIDGGLSKEIPSVISADLYIRTFIRIKCHPDNVVNYGFYLQQLKNINAALYAILHHFFEQWSHYSIADYHPDLYSYVGFCGDFMRALGAWTISSIHSKEKTTSHALLNH